MYVFLHLGWLLPVTGCSVSLENTSTKLRSCCPETRAGTEERPQETRTQSTTQLQAPGCCFGPKSSQGDEAGGSAIHSTATLQQHQQELCDGVCAVATDQQAGSAAGISWHAYPSYWETKCSFRVFLFIARGRWEISHRCF